MWRRGLARALVAVGVVVVASVAVAVWWFSAGQQQSRRNAALFAAARSADMKAVEAALDAGADVNARDGDGITSLMHAARGDARRSPTPARPIAPRSPSC